MRDEEFKGINVIPLVDIMLVLLVIVLTSATFIATGRIPVKLPEAKVSAQEKELSTLKIRLDKEGKLYLDSRPMSLGKLGILLRKKDRNTPVEVWSDRRASVGSLVLLLELLKKLGFRNVSLAVVRKDA
jgi:biopolymer transport protein ExbD